MVWLDDRREAPAGWVHVRTPEEAIDLLGGGAVEETSLDHDLGLDVEARDSCSSTSPESRLPPRAAT